MRAWFWSESGGQIRGQRRDLELPFTTPASAQHHTSSLRPSPSPPPSSNCRAVDEHLTFQTIPSPVQTGSPVGPFKGPSRRGPGAPGAAVARPLPCRVARASPQPPTSGLFRGQSLSFSCKRKRNGQPFSFTLSLPMSFQ